MKYSTLCYIEKGDSYLMLHRTKKENDANKDKWLGIGGKFEDRESPEDCAFREVKEETGLTVTKYAYRGIVTFISDKWETEYMHLFSVYEYDGDIIECNEGDLEWINKDELIKLNMWEGDRIFLELISAADTLFFSLKLEYKGETLVCAVLNGNNIDVGKEG